jgi:hypothetical protein
MNSADIAVWYALHSNYYLRNDAINGYYIYNTGNITYSGAGHSADQSTSTGSGFNSFAGVGIGITNEAKLFINTMIAAFRAPNRPPRLEYTNSADPPDRRSSYILPSDVDATATDSVPHPIYFRIHAPTVPGAETAITEMQFGGVTPKADGSGEYYWYSLNVPINRHRPNRDVNVDRTKLRPRSDLGVHLYYFVIPPEVRSYLGGKDRVKIRISVATTLPGSSSKTLNNREPAVLVVHKAGLMNML